MTFRTYELTFQSWFGNKCFAFRFVALKGISAGEFSVGWFASFTATFEKVFLSKLSPSSCSFEGVVDVGYCDLFSLFYISNTS